MESPAQTAPLVSIVIPTRNRSAYAVWAIRSILEIPEPALELVIQDNSDAPDLERHVSQNFRDRRLKYRYTPPPLSSIDNFNAAVELATGEYVCLIGDDDGVNPELIAAARWARDNDVDCLAVRNMAQYIWGDSPPGSGGVLSVWRFRGDIRVTDADRQMRRLVRNGGVYYLDFDLPKLYHGLVRRRCLTAIRRRTGRYFGGLSPDIFASLALASVARRVVVTDYPLTIPGACAASASIVEGASKRHSKRLADAPHFRHRGPYDWCEFIPPVYTVETIWAESGVAALRAMGRDDLVREFNLPMLAAHCLAANPGVAGAVLRALFSGLRAMGRNRAAGAARFAWCVVAGPGARLAARLWRRGRRLMGRRDVDRIDGLTNMLEVAHALTRYLEQRRRRFAPCPLPGPQRRSDA